MRTMKTLLLCGLMLTASLATADYVRTDYDRSAQFDRYRTFMWIKEPECANPLMNQLIFNAVNAELQGKGLSLVASDADLAISVNTATCENSEIFYAGLAGGWGWYHYWAPKPSITVLETFEVGTLVLNLYDTQTNCMVWWATGTEAEKSVRHLNKTVRKMFENFPPRIKREVNCDSYSQCGPKSPCPEGSTPGESNATPACSAP
jgi:Domain of unknown function (DUF4136)